MKSATYRPQFHFSATSGWINDPNGLVFHDGWWHLFYQHHPHSLEWGPMHWGHAVSRDLVQWEHLPIALEPDAMGAIWSGSALVDEGEIVLVFTYQNPTSQSVALARLVDESSFEKWVDNPVLTSDSPDFRDPKVFRFQNEWRLIIAAGSVASIFASTDLKRWNRLSSTKAPHEGWIWECPDLLRLDNRWVLVASFIVPGAPHQTLYWLGDFDGERFTPETQPARLSFGPDDYAAISWENAPDDRRVVIGWMNAWTYAAQTPTEREGFRGAMTLPRELSIRGDKLLQNPARELRRYRGQACDYRTFRGSCFEIEATIDIGGSWREPVGFALGNGDERTEIYLLPEKGEWRIDRTTSGVVDFHPAFADWFGDAFLGSLPREIHLQIFVDNCSVELFAQHGEFYGAALIFPTSNALSIAFLGGEGARLVSCTVYPFKAS